MVPGGPRDTSFQSGRTRASAHSADEAAIRQAGNGLFRRHRRRGPAGGLQLQRHLQRLRGPDVHAERSRPPGPRRRPAISSTPSCGRISGPGECDTSSGAPRFGTSPGLQYFQYLLGYEVRNLDITVRGPVHGSRPRLGFVAGSRSRHRDGANEPERGDDEYHESHGHQWAARPLRLRIS